MIFALMPYIDSIKKNDEGRATLIPDMRIILWLFEWAPLMYLSIWRAQF